MNEVPYKAVAMETCSDEDWKTQTAQGYGNIPKGAEESK